MPLWLLRCGRCPDVRQWVSRKLPPPGAQLDCPFHCRLSLKSPITRLDQEQITRCICLVYTQPTLTCLAANFLGKWCHLSDFHFLCSGLFPPGPSGLVRAAHSQGLAPHPLKSGAEAADAIMRIVHCTPPGGMFPESPWDVL